MELIFDLRYIIVLMLCTVIFAIFEWTTFKTKAIAVMLAIKQLSKSIVLSGKEQETMVVNKLFSYLPNWIHKAIPEDILRRIIAYLYNQSMDYLDDGVLNDSRKEKAGSKDD